MSLERRRTPRIPFLATAEIIDEAENTRTTSQLSDLSLHGCFVQLPNPFPEGTPVTIEIYKDEDFAETSATVAFLMPKRGMGLSFTGMEPQFASLLKKALAIESYRPPGLKRDNAPKHKSSSGYFDLYVKESLVSSFTTRGRRNR